MVKLSYTHLSNKNGYVYLPSAALARHVFPNSSVVFSGTCSLSILLTVEISPFEQAARNLLCISLPIYVLLRNMWDIIGIHWRLFLIVVKLLSTLFTSDTLSTPLYGEHQGAVTLAVFLRSNTTKLKVKRYYLLICDDCWNIF